MRLVWISVVAGLLMPLPANAQTADATNVKGSSTVYVTDPSGRETEGRLVSWTGTTFVVQTGGTTKTFSPGEAVRVDLKGDSLKNGALIGAGVGVLMGGLASGVADGGGRAVIWLTSIGLYSAIGTAIDALIPGRTLLWRAGTAQGSQGGFTVRVSPQQRSAFAGWTITRP